METGRASGADAAISEATRTRMLTATGLLLIREGTTGHCT